MPSNEKHGKLKAAIVISSVDNPSKAAEIAIWFSRHAGFDLEIVGYATLSPLDFPSAGLAIGIPVPGFAIKQCIRSARAEIHDLYSEVISILDKNLYIRPKFEYIRGPFNQIVQSLASTFEAIIIPHRLNLTMKYRIRRPALDTLIMKSKKIPVLFCTDTSVCGKIVATQIDSGISFQAEQISNRLASRLRVPIYRWFPKQSVDSVPLPETGKQKLSGIPDSCELDNDSVFTDQNGTLLAVPRAIILSIFRFHKIRLLLSNWEGNLLVLP